MTGTSHLYALANQATEVDGHAAVLPFVPGLSGFENLIHGAHEAIRIVQHQAIELVAPGVVHLAMLQGLKIEPDGSDGRFQFVRDGVNEAVMLFVAANFSYQETGIHDHPGDQQGEENYAEKKQNPFAPGEDDLADSQSDRQQYQANA